MKVLVKVYESANLNEEYILDDIEFVKVLSDEEVENYVVYEQEDFETDRKYYIHEIIIDLLDFDEVDYVKEYVEQEVDVFENNIKGNWK